MTNLTTLSIVDACALLRKRECSAVELTQAHLDAIERHKGLHSFITLTPERALEDAKNADARLARNEARGLEGIPIAQKDLFSTKAIRTTAGSRMLAHYIPPYESTVSQAWIDSGTVMLGKTNMDEYAMGSSNNTSYFGQAISPWTRDDGKQVVPGGSSGGSAAAVAGFLAMAATGSDTGGSIRQPAAFTGIVGVKPTYGRCSRYGMVSFASSLDQAGIFARSVTDAALVLSPIMGHDPNDSTSSRQPVPDLTGLELSSMKGLRLGIPTECRVANLDPDIVASWQKAATLLEEAGAVIVDVSIPMLQHGIAAYYIIAPAECSSNLARYDGIRFGHRTEAAVTSLDALYEQTRAEGFGPEVKRRILIGTYVLSSGFYDAYYRKAQQVRTLIRDDFARAFAKVDILLTPTTPTVAFPVDEQPTDPLDMYLNDLFTIPASLAGLPGMVVPMGLNRRGLPMGVQILAPHFEERRMFGVAFALEQRAGFTATPQGY